MSKHRLLNNLRHLPAHKLFFKFVFVKLFFIKYRYINNPLVYRGQALNFLRVKLKCQSRIASQCYSLCTHPSEVVEL